MSRNGTASGNGVATVIERALSGERLTDEDALVLLRSRDLVSVGRAADELRNRKVDRGRVTFIIDRNVNYTNICSHGLRLLRVLPPAGRPLRGIPAAQGGHLQEDRGDAGARRHRPPDAGRPSSRTSAIDYYEDLFTSIKARYTIHLHALSPPEVQHIARRSKLTIPQTLTRLRDAGLDSLPGGGAEILVDRVRDIISPKKTNVGRVARASCATRTGSGSRRPRR